MIRLLQLFFFASNLFRQVGAEDGHQVEGHYVHRDQVEDIGALVVEIERLAAPRWEE